MFGIEELKEKIGETAILCPIKDCMIKVERISKRDLKLLDAYLEERRKIDDVPPHLKNYFCERHRIFVTPSTFLYDDYKENSLWKEEKDMALLESILERKRVKAQLCHDNSEDAVTWNVFRFLEKAGLIEGFLSQIIGSPIKSPEVIYWSYSQKEGKGWAELDKARKEFGEDINRSSEPDIIIKTDNTLFFIEAKLTSRNQTKPTNANNPKRYQIGGNRWFSKVFRTDYETIAITEKKYELMRFWLLGTWLAKEQGLDLYLINLTREGKEDKIETLFGRHINETPTFKFKRLTWESICQYVSNTGYSSDKETIMRFFRNKAIGYDKNGELQKAFVTYQP